MIRLIRMVMQVVIARLLAWGPIGALWELWSPQIGISQEAVIDFATLFALGVMAWLTELAKRTDATAKILEWWNMIISLGQSKSDPVYVPVAPPPPLDDYEA